MGLPVSFCLNTGLFEMIVALSGAHHILHVSRKRVNAQLNFLKKFSIKIPLAIRIMIQ